ncbi:MAG TPA: ATP-binding protein [Polyangiales bacterium]|nr:ATP-binding protein [Polyangiales bacterium]
MTIGQSEDVRPDILRAAFQSSPCGIAVFDRAGTIIHANPELEQQFAEQKDALAGRSLDALFEPARDIDQPGQRVRRVIDHVTRSNPTQLKAAIEMSGRTSSGETRTFELRFARISDDRFIANVIDTSDRRARERDLRQRMRGLEQSNLDLEQFASIASHDLREPLRMVVSYTELLAERYRGQLDEKADKFISYAVQGATRMQRLIDDLLAYSRLENPGRPSLPTPTSDALRDTLSDMRAAIQDSGAQINYGSLPIVLVDPIQLTQLFQNLIHNAIKFRREDPPRIDLTAEPEGGMWRITVSDNGIGIEKRYHDRIFQMFQRLHERSKYEGNGIGLATARKIVERHGGTIGLDSTPGQGSTFFFTLPAAPTGPIRL